MIDQLLRPTRLVGNRRVPEVEPQPVVERGEDFLIMAWAIVRHCAPSIFRTHDLHHLHPSSRQPTA